MRALLATFVLMTGCTTISLARLDRCMVRKTTTLVNSREEVLFCDEDPPAWSNDRAVRLTQECLYQKRQMRHDAVLSSELAGEPAPAAKDADGVDQCLPEGVRTVQAENEALKERLARADAFQTHMEERHVALENGLTKALDRPINAVADARSTSDSATRHTSDMEHFNSGVAPTDTPIRVVVTPRGAAPRPARPKAKVAEGTRPDCPAPPAAPVPATK